MASGNESRAPRQSYTLSVPPVDTSQTQGTTIPPPPPPSDSPLQSPAQSALAQKPSLLRLSRPPTAAGGPLSSHPSHDDMAHHIPGAFPSEPIADRSTAPTKTSSETYHDSLTSPSSPATVPMMQHSPTSHRPNTVRRLFSLNSLRHSFSSSRTSLSLRPGTSHTSRTSHTSYRTTHNQSPSMFSTADTAIGRPSMTSTAPPSTLRNKRSSHWFKRKSSFIHRNDDPTTLDALNEDGPEHKKFKQQLPMLPEIDALSGGQLDGGAIDWDEEWFRG